MHIQEYCVLNIVFFKEMKLRYGVVSYKPTISKSVFDINDNNKTL